MPDEESFTDPGGGAMSLTPDYLAVMTEATNMISAIVARAIEEERPAGLKRAVIAALEKLHLFPIRRGPRLLTPEQLAQVREVALHKARDLNLSEAQAERLVRAVVGSHDT
jgi:hypothetical protein